MKNTKKALVLFTKNSQINKVKTRLAKDIGPQKALEVHKQLLNLALNEIVKVEADKKLFFSDFLENVNEKEGIDCFLQAKGDLGFKMNEAFKQMFEENYEQVVLIGSDCPDLNSQILEQAFQNLEKNDLVIGPAQDGGYYLIGLNINASFLLSEIFLNKEWSHENVYNDLIKLLADKKVNYGVLEKLSDIDNLKDLLKYNKKSNGNPLLFKTLIWLYLFSTIQFILQFL